MKQTFFIFSFFLILLSCGGADINRSDSQELPDDSAQLRIAVMPTLDCLPLYLADSRGWFEAAGIDVSLFPYQAQMDCDTAVERGTVNALVSDLVRVQQMNDKGMDLQVVSSTDAHWQLLTSRTARIKQLKQLDNKMMAMTRFSATHLLSDKVIDSSKVQPERVFLIQINDVSVRLNMLRTEILDALWLPEPQATEARNSKAYILADTRLMGYQLGVVAFRKRAATRRQTELFRKVYDEACDSINEYGLQSFSEIIKEKCGVGMNTIDSLPEMKFRHASVPRSIDSLRVFEWITISKSGNHVEKR